MFLRRTIGSSFQVLQQSFSAMTPSDIQLRDMEDICDRRGIFNHVVKMRGRVQEIGSPRYRLLAQTEFLKIFNDPEA